jgi:hypothetical protein
LARTRGLYTVGRAIQNSLFGFNWVGAPVFLSSPAFYTQICTSLAAVPV